MIANGIEIIVPGWILDKTVAPDAHLRQGDLVHFSEAKDPLRKAGIVVTADCDLEQKKHARLITLVPLIPPIVALEHYLIPEDCDRKRDAIELFLSKKFGIDAELDKFAKLAALRSLSATNNFDQFVWDALDFLSSALSIDERSVLQGTN